MAQLQTVPNAGQINATPDLMPYIRQGILLAGLAAAIAIGVSVALWTQEPNYQQLYGALSQKDATEVISAIQSSGIEYKLDGQSGAILVPSSKANELKMRLASQGLPKGNAIGLEVLQEDQSLSTSQFVEKARYNHAIEEELSRTISSISVVEAARVHLALPKQSIFVRKSSKPSASVMIKLYPGRVLEKAQVAAIIHIVASSIPRLTASMVTVVDQHGNLLSNQTEESEIGQSNKEYEYTRKMERHYQHQITDLLEPFVGVGKVKAQVSVNMDFTKTDSAKESYNPEKRIVRSEQISEDTINANKGSTGIPGALSNQPPGTGATDVAGEKNNTPAILNQSRSAVKNYEIDKTISHTKKQVGEIKRISIAVVVDNPTEIDEEGKVKVNPFSDDQLLRMQNIIKGAVGFVEERGDSINVMNTSFLIPKIEELPEQPIWEKAWLQNLVKQILGGIFVLVILLLIIKPLVKALTTKTLRIDEGGYPIDTNGNRIGANGAKEGIDGELQGQALLENKNKHSELDQLIATSAESSYEDKVEFAKKMIKDDPKRVANVVKEWVGENG